MEKGYLLFYDTDILFNEIYSEDEHVFVFDSFSAATKKAKELIKKKLITDYLIYSN